MRDIEEQSCGISFEDSPRVLVALVPHGILNISMSNFLRVQILSFVISDQTFGKDFELRAKIVDISNSIACQPLSCNAVFDEDRGASCNRGANCIESLLAIGMLDDPYGAGTEIACN